VLPDLNIFIFIPLHRVHGLYYFCKVNHKNSGLKKKFFTNLVLVLILNLLVKPFWIFGIDRSVQNVVGSSEYGLYFSLISFSFLLNFLLDLGITQYNNRVIARHPSLISRYFSQVFTLRLILGVLFILVSFLIALVIGYNARQMHLLLFLLINQFLLALILYLRSNLSGLLLLRTDSLVSVLDRFLMIVICSVLLWGRVTDRPMRIEWFVFAQTAAYLVTALVVFLLVYQHLDYFRPVFRRLRSLAILKQSMPFAVLVLLMSVYTRVDSVMLERLLPDGWLQAGIYAQSFRILDAFSMFAFLYAGLLFPVFSRMTKMEQPMGEMTRFSSVSLMIPVLTIVTALVVYRHEIMDLLYRDTADESYTIFLLLMVALVATSANYIFGTLLTANGNLRQLILIALSAAVINMVFNLLLIPAWKATGAAWASLFTQWMVALLQLTLAVKVFRFRVNHALLLRVILFVPALLATGWLCYRFMTSWTAGFCAIIAAGALWAYLTGLIRWSELKEIFVEKDTVTGG